MAKYIALIISLLAFCNTIGYAEESSEDLFILEREKIHKITKGMTVEDIYSLYGEEDAYPIIEEGAEGTTYEAIMINVDGEPALVANYDQKGIVYAVGVYDSRFNTEKGVSVGSEITEVLAHYQIELISDMHMPNMVGVVEDLGLRFEFDIHPEHLIGLWQENPSLIPKNTRVRSIWVKMR